MKAVSHRQAFSIWAPRLIAGGARSVPGALENRRHRPGPEALSLIGIELPLINTFKVKHMSTFRDCTKF